MRVTQIMKWNVISWIVSGGEHCEPGWKKTEIRAYGDGCVPNIGLDSGVFSSVFMKIVMVLDSCGWGKVID
jgi:hypothetical protein